MKSIVRTWNVRLVTRLMFFFATAVCVVLFLVSRYRRHPHAFPFASRRDGSTVVPPHRTLPPLQNVRWQPVPDGVISVYAAPDHRIWTQLRSGEPLNKGAFETMIEREYANPDPQYSGGLLLLAESPTGEVPRGRIWFELIHDRDPASRWSHDDHDEPWALLLGYSGVPGKWIERDATEAWDFGNRQIFQWWNTCICRDERRRHFVAQSGRAFFVHGDDVEYFDGAKWKTKTIGRGTKKNYNVELMPEPDNKGIVVLHPPTAPEAPNAPEVVPDTFSRWRDGDWKEMKIWSGSVEWHIQGYNPHMGVGGMWLQSRDGLSFCSFSDASDSVPTHTVGDFQWEHWARTETDEQGRLIVRCDLICKSPQSSAPPHVRELFDEMNRLRSSHNASQSEWLAANHEIELAKAGGVIVLEPDGSSRFSPGDPDQPVGLQAQIPDQRFMVIDTDGARIYAAGKQQAINICPSPPVMIFNPEAPDNVVQLTHTPEFDLHTSPAGFVVDDAGGIIAGRFQGGIFRFNGKAWLPVDGAAGLTARGLAAGHDGILVVLCANSTWRLMTPTSGATYASLEEMVEKNRELIAKAFFDNRLTGHGILNLSIAGDLDKNIWICCPQERLAKVLLGQTWQNLLDVKPSDVATIAAFSSQVYAVRSGNNSADVEGVLFQVRNGELGNSVAPKSCLYASSTMFTDFGPINAADGALWVCETNDGNFAGAVRIDPAGTLSRYPGMRPCCAEASGAVILCTGDTPGLASATAELRVWQNGKVGLPLLVSGFGTGGWGAVASSPAIFAGDKSSIWAFTAAGLQHLRGQSPTTLQADNVLYVIDGANPHPWEHEFGAGALGGRDFDAEGVSTLGYFVMVRTNCSMQPFDSMSTPAFSLQLVPIPKIPSAQKNTGQ